MAIGFKSDRPAKAAGPAVLRRVFPRVRPLIVGADERDVHQAHSLVEVPWNDLSSPCRNFATLSTMKDGAVASLKAHIRRRVQSVAPRCHESLKPVSPFSFDSSRPVRIAVHVRRGDIVFRDSHRLLGNDYFLNVIRGLEELFDSRHCERRYELFTELPIRSQPEGEPGEAPCDPNRADVDFGAESRAIAQFDRVPNLVKYVNTDPIEAIQRMATAHVVVISQSAFSYLASLLNARGVIIYHRFWHSPLHDWIRADDAGRISKRHASRRLAIALESAGAAR